MHRGSLKEEGEGCFLSLSLSLEREREREREREIQLKSGRLSNYTGINYTQIVSPSPPDFAQRDEGRGGGGKDRRRSRCDRWYARELE